MASVIKIYAWPFPNCTPVRDSSSRICASVGEEPNTGQPIARSWLCTRELNHPGLHEAGLLGGKKKAEWS